MTIAKLAFSLTALILTIVIVAMAVRSHFAYEATINAHWELADKSSTIQKKAEHIDHFVTALESQGFNGKHNAYFYPNANNSFDENLRALKSLQARLHEIEKMDVASFQYQTAIQQITQQEQGEAGDMLGVFSGVWTKENYPLLWSWIGGISITVIGVLWIIALMLFVVDV